MFSSPIYVLFEIGFVKELWCTTFGLAVFNFLGRSCNGKCDLIYRGLGILFTCCTELPIEFLQKIIILRDDINHFPKIHCSISCNCLLHPFRVVFVHDRSHFEKWRSQRLYTFGAFIIQIITKQPNHFLRPSWTCSNRFSIESIQWD